MVKEVKTKVNQSNARAIEVMPMLTATGHEGKIHIQKDWNRRHGVCGRQVRVRAREEGLCTRKAEKRPSQGTGGSVQVCLI